MGTTVFDTGILESRQAYGRGEIVRTRESLESGRLMDGRSHPKLGDLAEVDAALEAWARWAKSALAGLGWPSVTLAARVIEFGALGAASRHGLRTLEVDEVCELVERSVRRLKDIERTVVAHHYLNWEPIEVSARHAHMSPGRFRTLLHRARRSVKDYLDGAKLRYNETANTV